MSFFLKAKLRAWWFQRNESSCRSPLHSGEIDLVCKRINGCRLGRDDLAKAPEANCHDEMVTRLTDNAGADLPRMFVHLLRKNTFLHVAQIIVWRRRRGIFTRLQEMTTSFIKVRWFVVLSASLTQLLTGHHGKRRYLRSSSRQPRWQ